MTAKNEHPWQSGPRELFQFAVSTMDTADDISRRIAFLLLDVCVETTFRTYLSLPDQVSGSNVKHSERRRYAGAGFHDLAKGVGLAANKKISEDELHHAKFYHDIRNRLYHEGNGITVREEYVQGYVTLAATFLKQLVGIDGESMLPEISKQRDAADPVALKQMKEELPKDIAKFEHLINLVMERSEPRMIYPSTIRRLGELSQFAIATFPGKLQEFRELIEKTIFDQKLRLWLLNFLADDLSYDRPQVISNSQFVMELGENPICFYAFLIGMKSLPLKDVGIDTLDNWDDISFIQQDDYSIMGIYESAKHFADILVDKGYRLGMSDAQILERCLDLQGRFRSANAKLEGLTIG